MYIVKVDWGKRKRNIEAIPTTAEAEINDTLPVSGLTHLKVCSRCFSDIGKYFISMSTCMDSAEKKIQHIENNLNAYI